MKKRNIKENLISKEYDNNKKGKTLLKLLLMVKHYLIQKRMNYQKKNF